jgi:hypothetical protein
LTADAARAIVRGHRPIGQRQEIDVMADKRRKGSGWFVFLTLALLPVAYLLSFGPADYAVKYTGRGVKALMTVYAPVVWLHDHTVLREPLEWYAEFWTPK